MDDALGRVTALVDSELGELSSYAYMGVSRRISTALLSAAVALDTLGSAARNWPLCGPAASPRPACQGQTFAGTGGYTGLDRFGRTKDLAWDTPAASGDHRYQYTYDASGNRLTADVQQAVVNGVTSPADRDYEYGYDALDRLISSKLGALANGVVASPERESTWSLDTLGNWTGPPGGGLAGLTIVDSRSGPTVTSTFDHAVFASNELDAITFDPDGPGGAAPQTDECVYDPAGNLVLDGTYFSLTTTSTIRFRGLGFRDAILTDSTSI